MSILELEVARVFKPVIERPDARYWGAYGGRGSGKSWFFGGRAVRRAVKHRGARIVCLREVQKDLKESAKLLIEDTITRHQVPGFTVRRDDIATPGGGIIIFKGMKDYTADSIKSLEGFDVAWIEEAHTFSQKSLSLLRPTLFRKPGAQIWASWNPTRKSDPIDAFLRGSPPDDAVVVRANYDSNPWFPESLEKERLYDLDHSPSYRHIWDGDYASVVDGAYYAKHLRQAEQEGRITELAYDPMLERRAYWDLGYNDATAIWIVQFRGQRIYVMDYIEGSGQELSYYVSELRARGHDKALCVLPHDGAHHHVGKSPAEHLQDAGFRTRVVKNQGKGAAMRRIEAMRRLFPKMWFNAGATDAGREALGAYHERTDDKREIGLGPEHDWSSHASDAAGLMACDYEEPKARLKPAEPTVYTIGSDEGAGTGWMGA